MDDPMVIAARYGMVAHKLVNDAAKVVDDAFGKINKVDDKNQPSDKGPFTAGDAIVTLSRLMTIAATGAIGFARIPLQIQAEKGPLLLADHIATVAAIAVSDAEKVTEDFAESLDDIQFPQNQKAQLVESAIKLTSIGMIRGAEVLETVVAGPGRYRDPVFTSDPIDITPKNHDRELRVLKMGRQAVSGEDIAKLVEVIPKDRILAAGGRTFQLRVNAAGIPSGVFVGVVQPYKPGTNTEDGDDITVSLAL
jgi:hypothetical protein